MTHIISVQGDIDFNARTITGDITVQTCTVGGDLAVPRATYYKGDYAVTPSTSTQVIPIKGKAALNDITINPIPSNYGLITWNGSTITVS